jgi:hypothetical protein
MYVSPHVSSALLESHPRFASSEAEARQLLRVQFPGVTDISDDEMISTIGDLMKLQSTAPGKLPCTLIVLDELQQYADHYPEQVLRIQNVVESCSSRFGSKLLFLATGQSALQKSKDLSKLQGRFTVNIALTDKDVETVVRQVVLLKQEDKKPEIKAILDACSGEIDRHLIGTKIAPNSADTSELMVADYPLLPVRRRFWENVLRAVDYGGVRGQLRTQLLVVHEAVREVGDLPLGHVVAADRIYKQMAPDMRESGALLRDVEETIAKHADGSDDGNLRSRIAATIFLIGKLRDAGIEIGIKATAETLADLLVEDLPAGSAALRKRIPELLKGLLDSDELIQIANEYRLQTRAGSEWDQEFRRRFTGILADDIRIAQDRTAALKAASTAALKDVTFVHGAGKTSRKIEICFAQETPPIVSGAIPVWIRDEWGVQEKSVLADARSAGAESPVVFVYLPRRDADGLKRALAGAAAAAETITMRGIPTTDEGHVAKKGMETRRDDLIRQVGTAIAAVLKDARVFQGGGNEIVGTNLREAVAEATQQSIARLYTNFTAADFDAARWARVKERARQGAADSMKAIDYEGDVEKHPVCQAVLSYAGAAGKKGADIRKNFGNPPYGWQVDAVDGALLALLAGGFLYASSNGTAVAAHQLDNPKIGITEFRAQGIMVSPSERIEVRTLLSGAGIPVKPGQESAALPGYLTLMQQLAAAAGGPAPLPALPPIAHITALSALSGNEQLIAVNDQRAILEQQHSAWVAIKKEIAVRVPRWERLQRLLHHAASLPICDAIQKQVDAVKVNRSLLADPDPVPSLSAALASGLRARVTELRSAHIEAYSAKIGDLEEDAIWQQLTDQEQMSFRRDHGLSPVDPLNVGTDDELLNTLDRTPLKEWENKTAAISERIKAALLEAARSVEPKAERVILPSRTLNSADDVDTYLTEVRTEIMAHIESGHPVVI